MDTGIWAGRMQVARERIEKAAKVLAGRAGVAEPEWRTNADPDVSALWRLEAVAGLLDDLVGAGDAQAKQAKGKKAKGADPAGADPAGADPAGEEPPAGEPAGDEEAKP